ncbi:MAG: hypothetical protein METHSR3v1_720003 [Methanothrix sp.]|nr:MAG: hypothetical protein METHSR3v1_720003 [Methanothrix sp.]
MQSGQSDPAAELRINGKNRHKMAERQIVSLELLRMDFIVYILHFFK